MMHTLTNGSAGLLERFCVLKQLPFCVIVQGRGLAEALLIELYSRLNDHSGRTLAISIRKTAHPTVSRIAGSDGWIN